MGTNEHLGNEHLSKSELCVIDFGLLFSCSFIFIVLFEIKKLWIFPNERNFYFLTTMICNMDTN